MMHVRTVPTCPDVLGIGAREVEPDIKQIFVKRPTPNPDLTPSPSPKGEGSFKGEGDFKKEWSSWEFFDWMLRSAHVVCTPGAGFGECGEGYVRLTAFGTHENTEKALRRIANRL